MMQGRSFSLDMKTLQEGNPGDNDYFESKYCNGLQPFQLNGQEKDSFLGFP